jgi:hypothetical protein
MTNVTQHGNSLIIGNTEIKFEEEIQEALEYDGMIVVLFEYSGLSPEYKNQNIVGIDDDGNRLWKIDSSPRATQRDNPYTGVGIVDNNVIAHTWQGMAVLIDLDDGSWTSYGLTK